MLTFADKMDQVVLPKASAADHDVAVAAAAAAESAAQTGRAQNKTAQSNHQAFLFLAMIRKRWVPGVCCLQTEEAQMRQLRRSTMLLASVSTAYKSFRKKIQPL